MVAQTPTLIDRFRTIVWIDALIRTLGMEKNALDKLYFEKYVSRAMGSEKKGNESDRRFLRYYDGDHVPRPDPVVTQSPERGKLVRLDPLRAMELEAPGSARWFFLPLFNLLDGRIQSSEATLNWMAELDPEGRLFDDLFKVLSAEWKRGCRREGPSHELPACLTIRREESTPFSIRMVREEILRLNEDIGNALFQEKDGQLYRRQSPVSEEIDFLAKEISVERLTAAIGLYWEAELLGAVDRIQPIADLIEYQLPSLDKERNFKRVSGKLAMVVQMGFGPQTLFGYSRQEAEINGFPASWARDVRAYLTI